MIRIWIPVTIIVLLVLGAVAAGVYLIRKEIGCDPQQHITQSEYAGRTLTLLQPLISTAYNTEPERKILRDMSVKNTAGGVVHYAVLPIPNVFDVVDHLVLTDETCESTIFARLKNSSHEKYHMEISALQNFLNGERPVLSRFYTSNIEPNYENGPDSAYPFMIRFKVDETDEATTGLRNRLAELKLSFDTIGFDFQVANLKPDTQAATIFLSLDAATYLSQSVEFFHVAKLTPMAN